MPGPGRWKWSAKKRGPYYTTELAPFGVNAGMFFALMLAREFNRTPTAAQLQARFPGMSRATAYRWVKAWRVVDEIQAAREGAAA